MVNDTRVLLANILFDKVAQGSSITQALANQLKSTSYRKEHMCISSFGCETTPKSQVDITSVLLETDLGGVNISALVVPIIAASLHNFSYVYNLPHLHRLKLAHLVGTTEKFDIFLLLEADYYWEVVGNHCSRGRAHSHAIKIGLSVVRATPIANSIQ